MFFKQIESEGLAHYSYVIGDSGEAVVIDPRRDYKVYIREAHKAGFRIKYILETHRNEDYVIGSVGLAEHTGAEIFHADAGMDYRYEKAVEDGREFRVGGLKIKAIATPGHTPGSFSYLLHDHKGRPWIVFTGDCLFAGDVGRVDLPGVEIIEQMANAQYESIFEKLLSLDDEIIVCPGHGAGSVCGSEIAQKVFTTIGLERKYNPKLQLTNREDFVAKVGVEHERPPYFRKMEELNLKEFSPQDVFPTPPPLMPGKFEALMKEGAQVLDVRNEQAYASAHVPGSVSIWSGILSSFAGWFLSYDRPLLLVADSESPTEIIAQLYRIGFDNISGVLNKGMLSWHMSGRDSRSIDTVNVQSLCDLLDSGEELLILDIRPEDEIESNGRIPDAVNIHITQLPERIDEVPRNTRVFVFCGSGMRSMIGASILANAGYDKLTVVLGGLSGWKSGTCEIEL